MRIYKISQVNAPSNVNVPPHTNPALLDGLDPYGQKALVKRNFLIGLNADFKAITDYIDKLEANNIKNKIPYNKSVYNALIAELNKIKSSAGAVNKKLFMDAMDVMVKNLRNALKINENDIKKEDDKSVNNGRIQGVNPADLNNSSYTDVGLLTLVGDVVEKFRTVPTPQ